MKHAFTKRKLRSNKLKHKLNKNKSNSTNLIYVQQTKYVKFMSIMTRSDIQYEKINNTIRPIISKRKLISDASQKYQDFPEKSIFHFIREKATQSSYNQSW